MLNSYPKQITRWNYHYIPPNKTNLFHKSMTNYLCIINNAVDYYTVMELKNLLIYRLTKFEELTNEFVNAHTACFITYKKPYVFYHYF